MKEFVFLNRYNSIYFMSSDMPTSLLGGNSGREPSLDLYVWKTEYLRQEVFSRSFQSSKSVSQKHC